ncbi:MAG: Plug domain-containing protein [Chthoniobacterales bacterium]|nr:Plug domain-containing protein [Chthoniobacterales bacterium]
MDADDLKRSRGANLEDFIRYRPGLVVQSGEGSEDNKVSIRGSGVQNEDLSGLSVLIDGIAINQADREAYLYHVDLQSVDL